LRHEYLPREVAFGKLQAMVAGRAVVRLQLAAERRGRAGRHQIQ